MKIDEYRPKKKATDQGAVLDMLHYMKAVMDFQDVFGTDDEEIPRCKTCGVWGPYYCTLGDRCENKLRMEGKEY